MQPFHRESHRLAVDVERAAQLAFLPFLEIAHKTVPSTLVVGLEHQFVVGRLCRFEQKHLDECACLLAEVHSRLYHLGIVEHH